MSFDPEAQQKVAEGLGCFFQALAISMLMYACHHYG